MAKYRKKPVVIEAFKWTAGPEQEDDPEWIVKALMDGDVWFEEPGSPDVKVMIRTLEGVMEAKVGDYIIRGVAGEIYPCKAEIFEKTYEPVYEEPEVPVVDDAPTIHSEWGRKMLGRFMKAK